jgi:hypothetical protein
MNPLRGVDDVKLARHARILGHGERMADGFDSKDGSDAAFHCWPPHGKD